MSESGERTSDVFEDRSTELFTEDFLIRTAELLPEDLQQIFKEVSPHFASLVDNYTPNFYHHNGDFLYEHYKHVENAATGKKLIVRGNVNFQGLIPNSLTSLKKKNVAFGLDIVILTGCELNASELLLLLESYPLMFRSYGCVLTEPVQFTTVWHYFSQCRDIIIDIRNFVFNGDIGQHMINANSSRLLQYFNLFGVRENIDVSTIVKYFVIKRVNGFMKLQFDQNTSKQVVDRNFSNIDKMLRAVLPTMEPICKYEHCPDNYTQPYFFIFSPIKVERVNTNGKPGIIEIQQFY